MTDDDCISFPHGSTNSEINVTNLIQLEDLGIIPKQHHPRVNPLQAMKLRHAQQQPGLPSHVCLGAF